MLEKPNVLELLVAETNRKQDLTQKILIQMTPDFENKKLSGLTRSQVNMARDNFEACLLKIKAGEIENAIYLFSRGCWNLGEAMGRAKLENPDHTKECLPPESLA